MDCVYNEWLTSALRLIRFILLKAIWQMWLSIEKLYKRKINQTKNSAYPVWCTLSFSFLKVESFKIFIRTVTSIDKYKSNVYNSQGILRNPLLSHSNHYLGLHCIWVRKYFSWRSRMHNQGSPPLVIVKSDWHTQTCHLFIAIISNFMKLLFSF